MNANGHGDFTGRSLAETESELGQQIVSALEECHSRVAALRRGLEPTPRSAEGNDPPVRLPGRSPGTGECRNEFDLKARLGPSTLSSVHRDAKALLSDLRQAAGRVSVIVLGATTNYPFAATSGPPESPLGHEV
jgi:hypothetical protein